MTDPFLEIPILERTVAALLEQHVTARPDKVALIDEDSGRSVTYAEFDRVARTINGSYSALGVGRQETVLVMLDNHVDHVLAWLGALIGAMVEVPINTAYKGDMLKFVIERSGASVLVIEGKYCDRLAVLGDEAPNLRTVRSDATHGVYP